MKSLALLSFLFFPIAICAAPTCLIWEKVITRHANGTKKLAETYCNETKLEENLYDDKGTQLQSKDYLWSSVPFGIWRKYTASGNPKDSGNFIVGDHEQRFLDSTISGPYEEFSASGVLVLKTNFVERFLSGEWSSFYPNGKTWTKALLIGGRGFINEQSYYPNGMLGHASRVVDMHSFIWEYDSLGLPEMESEFLYGRRVKYRQFNDAGQLEKEILEPNDSTEIFTYFYPNGQVSSQSHERLNKKNHIGLRHEAYVSYYSSGRVNSIGEFQFGHNSGVWNWYYEDGTPLKMMTFGRLGYRTGPYTEHYPNGRLRIRGNFTEDKYNGPFTIFDSTGGVLFNISDSTEGLKYKFKFTNSADGHIEYKRE